MEFRKGNNLLVTFDGNAEDTGVLGYMLLEAPKYDLPEDVKHLIAPRGTHNGYVIVSNNHKWFPLDYDDVDVDVHGGLTYKGNSMLGAFEDEVTFLMPVTCFGFDTAHYDDNPERWNFDNTLAETLNLVDQFLKA